MIRLRGATPGDAEALYRWRTEPRDRAAYFIEEPIPYEDHVRWLAARLARDATRIYMIEAEGALAGMVRFERTAAGEAEVAIAIDPTWRRQGVGAAALAEAIPRAARELGAKTFVAIIRPENQASLQLFERAGFADAGTTERAGKPGRRLVLGTPTREIRAESAG